MWPYTEYFYMDHRRDFFRRLPLVKTWAFLNVIHIYFKIFLKSHPAISVHTFLNIFFRDLFKNNFEYFFFKYFPRTIHDFLKGILDVNCFFFFTGHRGLLENIFQDHPDRKMYFIRKIFSRPIQEFSGIFFQGPLNNSELF